MASDGYVAALKGILDGHLARRARVVAMMEQAALLEGADARDAFCARALKLLKRTDKEIRALKREIVLRLDPGLVMRLRTIDRELAACRVSLAGGSRRVRPRERRARRCAGGRPRARSSAREPEPDLDAFLASLFRGVRR